MERLNKYLKFTDIAAFEIQFELRTTCLQSPYSFATTLFIIIVIQYITVYSLDKRGTIRVEIIQMLSLFETVFTCLYETK